MRDDVLQDEAPEPSRSQLRRDALDIFRLAEALSALGEAELARVPLDDDLREEVRRTRAVKSHIARKRQTQFLAKQLRKLDDDAIEAIRTALGTDRDKAHRETAAMHRIESWRERLLDEGDDALGEFIASHPSADRQRLRQLVRNALAERNANKPPHAYRELFRELRDVLDDNA
jgi:ribosome-associated protein